YNTAIANGMKKVKEYPDPTIGSVGGPRCCKRDSYLSILSAIDFVKEHFDIEMEKPEIVCGFSSKNNQCLGKRCPFSKANH
ncbi:MAG: DUF5714 domain-containing protein, partial [Lachnospiraceae bacterium]|nr:DUF5714 domain-containing protein [Lachnospiraceae bacterium]